MARFVSNFLFFLTIYTSVSQTVQDREHPAAIPRHLMKEVNPAAMEDWNMIAQNALKEALAAKLNTNVAKNVILFLGDGMGISSITAGRIYAGQVNWLDGESYQLSFDKFPHVSLAKTYNVNHQVPDSAGTATAYLCGEKANLGVIGVNQNVVRDDCSTMSEENNIDSILRWSINEGKRTGVVTTTRITHATPAASYAHVPERDYEVDSAVPEEFRNGTGTICEDIASQLITRNSDINVILGGGRKYFLRNTDPDYKNASNMGLRTDNRNLIQEWIAKKIADGQSYSFMWNYDDFNKVDPVDTDYVLGLFNYDHMKYFVERKLEPIDEPTLPEMTAFAIKKLQKSEKGYFLLVEGGRIDQGHHANWAKAALSEVVGFDEAVAKAVEMTSEEDTLIVVTADHSHVFTMGGYPSRNNSIIDFVDDVGQLQSKPLDNMTYITLNYANGATGEFGRQNLSGVDVTSDDFRNPSLIYLGQETHGGEDVAVFARGPMSHLFRGVQEQNYIAHAMAYASCVGQNKEHCTNSDKNFAAIIHPDIQFLFMLIVAAFFLSR